jgi:hypothetical protein
MARVPRLRTLADEMSEEGVQGLHRHNEDKQYRRSLGYSGA